MLSLKQRFLILITGGFMAISGTQCSGPDPFPLKTTAALIPVVKPRRVFQDNDIRLHISKSRIAIDQKPFQWTIPENIKDGRLVLSFVVDAPDEPAPCTFYIHQKRKITRHLYTKVLSPEMFEYRDTNHVFSETINLKASFLSGDRLTIGTEFSTPRPRKLRCGISIPRIRKQSVPPEVPPVSLILISIDTLRWDHVGIYREWLREKKEIDITPHLDEFARNAATFKNAFTQVALTWPALTSMFLSLHPPQHGVMVHKKHLKYTYDSIATQFLDRGYNTMSLMANAFWLNIAGFEDRFSFFNRDVQLLDSAREKIANLHKKPFFHWYHLMGVHDPYTPPQWVKDKMHITLDYQKKYNLMDTMCEGRTIPPEDVTQIRKSYAGEMMALDTHLKKTFDTLKQAGLWDSTMIIVTADHGEDLYQRNGHFFHHLSIYSTGIRIPLMIKFPFQKEGLVIEENVSLLDIFPTIIDYFSLDPPQSHPMEGDSLLDIIRGDRKQFKKRMIVTGSYRYRILSAIYKKWHFIYNPMHVIPTKYRGKFTYPIRHNELYRFTNDPYEVRPVADRGIKNTLSQKLRAFSNRMQPIKPADAVIQAEPSEKDREKINKEMENLGYIE